MDKYVKGEKGRKRDKKLEKRKILFCLFVKIKLTTEPTDLNFRLALNNSRDYFRLFIFKSKS